MMWGWLDVSPNISRISSGSYWSVEDMQRMARFRVHSRRTEKSSNLHSRFCVVAGFEVHRLFTVCRISMTGLVLTPTCSPFARALACRRIEGAQGGRVAGSSQGGGVLRLEDEGLLGSGLRSRGFAEASRIREDQRSRSVCVLAMSGVPTQSNQSIRFFLLGAKSHEIAFPDSPEPPGRRKGRPSRSSSSLSHKACGASR